MRLILQLKASPFQGGEEVSLHPGKLDP